MTDTELESRKNLLRSSILGNLPSEEVDTLARTFQSRDARPNEFIFREGDPADAFYIIGSGQVKTFVGYKNSIRRELSVLGPGEHFGETALLAGGTRYANVVSMCETHFIVLAKDQFDRLLQGYPDLSRKFVREMRGWLVKNQELIEEKADAVFRASRIHWSDFLLVFGVSVLLAITFSISNPYGIPLVPERPHPVAEISAFAAMEEYRDGHAIIVDAMPSNFYSQRHIKGAINMPAALFDIVHLMSFSEADKRKKIVIYGNTISRPYDLDIASKLLLKGYADVRVMKGGLREWETCGYPVEQKVPK